MEIEELKYYFEKIIDVGKNSIDRMSSEILKSNSEWLITILQNNIKIVFFNYF